MHLCLCCSIRIELCNEIRLLDRIVPYISTIIITITKTTTYGITKSRLLYPLTHFLLLVNRKVKTVKLRTTLEDLLGTRQEGYICRLKCPPRHKSVHGWIRLELTQEELFFQESLSGIQKREIGNYRLEAKVQFSVNKNDMGFFAKDLYIKVRETL